MKITGVTIDNSLAQGCIVELHTTAALSGIGIGPSGIQPLVESLVSDVLNGKDPRAVAAHWQRMQSVCDRQPGVSLPCSAAATLDAAMWDLKAKANNEPLWKCLGGMQPRANIYASDAGVELSDVEFSGWCQELPARNRLHEGKLRSTGDLDSDLGRLTLLHGALAQSAQAPVLMLGIKDRWTPESAIEYIAAVENQVDLTWVEVATTRSNPHALKRLSEGVGAAVCAGKDLHTLAAYLPYFEEHALDIVQINIDTAGISGALQIADAAYGYELPVTLCASPGNIGAHLSSALPYFMSMEIVDLEGTRGIFDSDVSIENGRAMAGGKAGTGISFFRDLA